MGIFFFTVLIVGAGNAFCLIIDIFVMETDVAP